MYPFIIHLRLFCCLFCFSISASISLRSLATATSYPKCSRSTLTEFSNEQVVEIALQSLEKSPGELAWYITDTQEYFISEASEYRILWILRDYDLVASPDYVVLEAGDTFRLWQTDFT